MSGFLVESALLAHGLKSIPDERLEQEWARDWQIAWMEQGKVRIGNMAQFCAFRRRAADYGRIHAFNFKEAEEKGLSGALTASGTLRVCERESVPLVVTCGIGGLQTGQTIASCHDLSALHSSGVSMVAAAFKDMFDFQWSVQKAQESGVRVCVKDPTWEPGYLFVHSAAGKLPVARELREGTLYFCPIPGRDRIGDRRILEEAVRYGREQEAKGEKFHPAVNAKLDECTGGKTSDLQLTALLCNIRWAEELTGKRNGS